MKKTLLSTLILLAFNTHSMSEIWSDVTFVGDVSTQTWAAIAPISVTTTNGGTYTNGTWTNSYRISATNWGGRIPLSTNVVVVRVANAATSAVVLRWPAHGGISRYVVERSYDAGTTWTNWATTAAGTTNFTDNGSNTWTASIFTNLFSQVANGTWPWATPQMVTDLVVVATQSLGSMQAQISSNDAEIGTLTTRSDTMSNQVANLSNGIPWGLATTTNTATNLFGTSAGSTATGTYVKVSDYAGYQSYYLANGGIYGSFWVWYDASYSGGSYVISTNQGTRNSPWFVRETTTNFLGSYVNQQAGFPVVIADARAPVAFASLAVYSAQAGTSTWATTANDANNLGGIPASSYLTNAPLAWTLFPGKSGTLAVLDTAGITNTLVFTNGLVGSWATNGVEIP